MALEGPVDRPGGNYARMQADFRDGRFFSLRATCAKFDLFILVPLFKLCRVVWSLWSLWSGGLWMLLESQS